MYRRGPRSSFNFRQVQDLLHEFLLEAIRDDPSRYTPWAHNDPPHYPSRDFVERFLNRHGLTDKVRKTFGNPKYCNICYQRFPVRESLIEHKRNVHLQFGF